MGVTSLCIKKMIISGERGAIFLGLTPGTLLVKTVIYGDVFMRSWAVSHDRNQLTPENMILLLVIYLFHTPPVQFACYLPSIASTHLYTWVKRSNYGEVPYGHIILLRHS